MIIFHKFEHTSLSIWIIEQDKLNVDSNFPNLFLIYRVHVNLDLKLFGRKKAKTIVSIAILSEKRIHVLKLLALVCPKKYSFVLREKF